MIIHALQQNTFLTANDLRAITYSKHYFLGNVSAEEIRIKNALRPPINPSPILHISLDNSSELTNVTINDDTEDEIRTNRILSLVITSCIAFLILLTSIFIEVDAPQSRAVSWGLLISLIIVGIGFFSSYIYRVNVKLNQEKDLEFLVRLLKK